MKALVIGISGQDGAYLAKFLLEKNYEVVGTSRDAMMSSFSNLKRLGISDKVHKTSMAVNDFRSVLSIVQKYKPDEIYNLAGQTSVALSFEQPVEAMQSILDSTLNILEVMRFVNTPIRFYSAGSSECFGDTAESSASEVTPFQPRSPYAVAKASAYWLVRNYREAYGLFACTGILFNHESPLRPERFVTQKIIRTAARIANGSNERLELGNINVYRDWGWAADYVEAMWLMLQQNHPEDYVIATGVACSLENFVSKVFEFYKLDWRQHVSFNNQLRRPTDIKFSCGNPSKARHQLGWVPQKNLDMIVQLMCADATK